jgi:hypothetical protein
LNLPMECSLVMWKLNSCLYPPRWRDVTRLRVLIYELPGSDRSYARQQQESMGQKFTPDNAFVYENNY